MNDRFWSKVERGDPRTDNCWLWTASLSTRGYGRFAPAGERAVQAHRFAYELLVGPIPAGLTLDHLCRVRRCVNPMHLEPVTNRENLLRGDTLPARQLRRTHCPHGHSLTRAYLRKPSPRNPYAYRICRDCRNLQDQAKRRRDRLAATPDGEGEG